ncbi:WD40 repeat domain-containing protein [Endozoicomonadaceae bacterium StTr2]
MSRSTIPDSARVAGITRWILLFLYLFANNTFSFGLDNAAELYDARIRDWFFRFSDESHQMVGMLDEKKDCQNFGGLLQDRITGLLSRADRIGGQLVLDYPQQRSVLAAAINPDGCSLVAGDVSHASVFQYTDGKWAHQARLCPFESDEWIQHVSFSPKGTYTVVTKGGVVQLYHRGGEPAGRVYLDEKVQTVSFTADEKMFVTAGSNGKAKIWRDAGDGSDWTEHAILEQEHQNLALHAIINADGTQVVTWHKNDACSTVFVWGIAGDEWVIKSRLRHEKYRCIWHVAFNPKENSILTVSGDYKVRVWDLDNAAVDETEPVAVFDHEQLSRNERLVCPSGALKHASFNPDGDTLITASHTAKVCVNEAEQWHHIDTFPHDAHVRYACFSPGGTLIVTVCKRDAIIWARNRNGCWVEKGRITTDSLMESVCFSPDETLLLTKSFVKAVQLWELTRIR